MPEADVEPDVVDVHAQIRAAARRRRAGQAPTQAEVLQRKARDEYFQAQHDAFQARQEALRVETRAGAARRRGGPMGRWGTVCILLYFFWLPLALGGWYGGTWVAERAGWYTPPPAPVYSPGVSSGGRGTYTGGTGCGSRGGPGYRLPSGKCASWKD